MAEVAKSKCIVLFESWKRSLQIVSILCTQVTNSHNTCECAMSTLLLSAVFQLHRFCFYLAAAHVRSCFLCDKPIWMSFAKVLYWIIAERLRSFCKPLFSWLKNNSAVVYLRLFKKKIYILYIFCVCVQFLNYLHADVSLSTSTLQFCFKSAC